MKFQADVKRWVQVLGRLVVTNAKRSKTPDLDVEQTKANTLGQKRVRQWLAAGTVAVVVGAGIAFAAGENYGVSQKFTPNSVLASAPLNKSTLEITVFNVTSGGLGSLNLTSLLDAGVSIAPTANPVNSAQCAGATIGGSGQNVTITGGSLPAGASCVFKIDVVASNVGTLNATIAAGSPLAGSTTVPAVTQAELSVSNQTMVSPTMVNVFSPPSIYPGATSTGTTTISNANAAVLPNGQFNIPIPPNATLTGTPTISGGPECSSASVNVVSGVIQVTGLNIPAKNGASMGSCILTYPLTATALGNYPLSTAAGTFTAANGAVSNSNVSNASFNVVAKPAQSIAKSFLNNAVVGGPREWVTGQEPRVRLTVYNQTDSPWSNIKLTDNVPNPLEVSTGNLALGGTCNATTTTVNADLVSFVVPNLAANSSCTIEFNTIVPPSVTSSQTLTNEIAANTMTHEVAGTDVAVNNNSASDTVAINFGSVATADFAADPPKSMTGNIGNDMGVSSVPDAIAGGRVLMSMTVTKAPLGQQVYPLINGKISDDWSSSASSLEFGPSVTLGAPLPASEIAGNSCGAGAVFTAVNSQRLVISNISLPENTPSCTVRWYVNVKTNINVPDPLTGLQHSNTAIACIDNNVGATTTVCQNGPGQGNSHPSTQANIEVFGPQPIVVRKLNQNESAASAALGQKFDYRFDLANRNALDAVNVKLVDMVPAGIKIVQPLEISSNSCTGGSSTTGVPTVSGQQLTWIVPLMSGFNQVTGAHSFCTLILSAVSDGASVGPSYTNSIAAGGVTVEGQPSRSNTNVTESVMVFMDAPEGLSLVKDFSQPVVFKENGNSSLETGLFGTAINEATFLELTLRNSSTTNAFNNVVFTDSLPTGVELWTPATPVTTGTTCENTTVDGSVAGKVKVTIATLSATQTCKVFVQVIGTVNGKHTNTIPANSVTTNEGATNLKPTSKDLTVVSITPSITLYKDVVASGGATTIHGGNVGPGSEIVYKFTLKNSNFMPVKLSEYGKLVTDTLPTGVTPVSADNGGTISGQTVTWNFSNSTVELPNGGSFEFSVTAKVDLNATGTLANIAKLTPTSTGPSYGSCGTSYAGADCLGTPRVDSCAMPVNPLALTPAEIANPNTCQPAAIAVNPSKHALTKDVRKKGSTESFIGGDVMGGDELTYVITVKNTGTGNLSLKDMVKQVTDAVPVGTTVTTIGTGGVNNGGTITWDLTGDSQVLSAGATREFTFDVKVNESATLPITNVAKTSNVSSCPINDTTCINNPPVSECTMPANPLSVTDVEKADPKVCKPVVNNLIVDTTLFIEKTVDRKQAELGDMLKYTIRVKNAGKTRATAVKVSDTLPLGFRYIENTTRKSDGSVMEEPAGAPGPALTFDVGDIAAGTEVAFTYRVRIGVGAMEGEGTNRAKACTTTNKILCSNEGRAKVVVQGGVFTDKACLAGMAYADVNGNSMKDSDEKGVPGVRLYMEDGTNFTTDATGKYSYCGIEPRTHVLKVDKASLPRGSELLITSNRNMGDANSMFLDVKNGELHRGDVAIKPKNEQFMKELELRIKGIYDDASTNGVTFDSAPK